jgi:hypothetical protein
MNFRNALLSTLIIEVSIALLAVINYGTSLEALQAVTRFSGRVSLAIFQFNFFVSESQTCKTKRHSFREVFSDFCYCPRHSPG